MFKLILCLIFVLSEADALLIESEIQFIAAMNSFGTGFDGGFNSGEAKIKNEIRLNYSNETFGNHTIWMDKPLKVVIENCNARYIWCNKYYVTSGSSPIKFLPETEFNNDLYCIINIPRVTAEMNTRWACTVLTNYVHGEIQYKHKGYIYTAKDLRFNVHVKGARQVNLTVNDHILNYNVTTSQSVDYYGTASYTYADGEEVELSCKKSSDDTKPSDTLRLEYFNAEGNLLFVTKNRINKHTFRSIMKSTNNKYYIDCIWASKNPAREYRYRTTFYVKRDEVVQPAIILSVNGQHLTTFSNQDMSYDDYIFRYVHGEDVNVTCQINKYLFPRNTLHYQVDSKLTYVEDSFSPESGFVSLKVSPFSVKNKNLICTIKNTDADKPNSRLLFLPDIPYGEVRVYGLPRNNILYQYTSDLYQWTMEYQYSVNENINLTCVSNGRYTDRVDLRNSPLFQWNRKGQVNSSINKSSVPSITFSDSFFLELYASDNGTKIQCIYFSNKNQKYVNHTVEIILRLKSEPVSEEEIQTEEEATSGIRNKEDSYPDPFNKDSFVPMTVPIASAVGVIVTVITVICLVWWRKRTKRLNLIENNYDSLSNENDSTIPAFPSQWEANYNDPDYAKIYEDIRPENCNRSTDDDQLYKLPYNRDSNISENHYTEIDDYFKPKPDGIAANWNSDQSSNHNKDTNKLKPVATHNSKTVIYNNVIDTKQGNYDHLVHHNLPVNKSNENYSNVQSKGKNKSVTFKDTSRDLERRCYYSEGNSRRDSRKYENRLKQNANTDQNIYMQPGDMQKKSYYENDFPHNKKTVNQLILDPQLLDSDFEIICKNELYGISQ